jgi:putative peptidoglycan lipid II flippase
MLPAISLMGLVTLAGAALQVYRRFARPALATAIYNLTFVATLLAAPLTWPLGRAAWGVTLGAAAALVLQLPLLWRHRPLPQTAEVSEDFRSLTAVGQVARLAGPLAAGYAVHHAILFVDRAMATALGAGSAATLNYAYHLALVVGQLSGLAVSTALFPRLAEQVADNDVTGARAGLAGALRFAWLVGLPATCGLILLRTPLVRLLFERGAFDPAATAAVSGSLVWYALAVLADALCQPLWRVVYARRSAWTVLAVNGLQTGIRLLGNLALTPACGYNGLALSAALGLSVQVGVLGWLVRRWLGTYLMRTWWRDAARVALATAVAAVAAGLLIAQLSTAPPVVTLLAGGTLGGLAYLAVLAVSEVMRKT